MDYSAERLSIKNLLFTKAIPNYEIPVPIEGYKVYGCTDCGDKFLFKSSYDDHVGRKSMFITYMCRHCNQTKTFFNRCKLLCHIRSHTFKTATINVQDLKVEPVPIGVYKYPPSNAEGGHQPIADGGPKTVCYECKKLVPSYGAIYKDRASHFMKYSNMVFSCPVCLFTLPTVCGLRAHMRFHLKCPPYFCPECGVNISNKNMSYPFNHDCEGFNMMRATARLKCPVPQCQLFHPNDFKDHMKTSHIKKVFKCPICVVACFNEPTMNKHLKCHNTSYENKALIFYQCELCPGRLVLQNHIDNHLRSHVNTSVFPCWTCGATFKEVFVLIDHLIKKHGLIPDILKDTFTSLVNESENGNHGKPKRVYRVVKRCDQCKRNFTYKCKYNEIQVLPNECPYRCTSKLKSKPAPDRSVSNIKCQMCNMKIPSNWKDIKKHYATSHKNLRCLEPKLVIKRIDINKYLKESPKKVSKRTRKRHARPLSKKSPELEQIESNVNEKTITTDVVRSETVHDCSMCAYSCGSKESLETHLITHRDPCMAYQCLECGQSFVVKPSFSKHLVLEHGIEDAEAYINSKQCYNETALEKNQNVDTPVEPLKENQCAICRDEFQNAEDLEKHFRVHGMAFLLKNTSNKTNENASDV